MIMIIVIIVYRDKAPLHSLTMGYLFAITVSQEREVTVVLLVGHHPKTSSDFVKTRLYDSRLIRSGVIDEQWIE
ncbi:hypothetical protein BEE12_20650 (plasmid) [Pantoea agglomerans]|nr:hypothetical protein BEE12_20650 [Pantoea agglomerans]